MDAAEVEFLAEKLPISIVPNFAQDKLYLISGDVGPFSPGIPVEVPLWLGLNLRQRSKCRIVIPDWLDEEKLAEKKEEEAQSKVFTQMPCEHYMIVKTLLKDIWDLRISKLRSSVADFILSEGSHAKLDRLTHMEINSIRPFLPHSLDQFHRLAKSAHNTELSQTQDL
ncbi:hypothetical protein O3P69_008427 [Scylla paramamosain]|uniref:DNA replication complex GINS protein PSF2 n=1 Tax=Scylla paramamosain TaxID=85552 RepID=A0AAW0SLI6_SCYPA